MSPPARPTIIDVARVAGVTKGTASKALAPNGGRYPVSAATRERVLAAARDLGFAPADKAGKRHDRIALLFMGEAPNLDGINLGLHVALTEHLRRRRLDVVYQSMDRGSDDARRRALARVDGCLLISRTPALEREWDPWLAILAHLPPAVALNAGIRLPIPQIEPDDAGGAARLLDHLVGHGHRRLAMVGRRQQPTPQHGSHHQRHGALMTQARQAGVGLQGSSWAWQVLVTDCEFRGQTRAAALVTSSGLTVVRGTVTEVPVAVEVVAGKSDRLYLGDCRFERITGAVVRADARSQVVMERSTLLDVPTVLDRRSDTTAGMAGGYLLRSLVSGVSLELVGDTTARRAAVVTTPLEPVAVLPPPVPAAW
jgi:DNA-binding LacI/PurR family transcriptional regulator